jgi:hypothetical protein
MQGESQRTHDLLTDATFRLARLEREVAGRRRARRVAHGRSSRGGC